MIEWSERLSDLWTEVLLEAPVALQYRSKLLSSGISLNILVAIRAIDNAPCLMLRTTLALDHLFELGGMRLQLVPDDAGQLLVLSLEDENRRDLFTTICADVVSASAHDNADDALVQFITRLDAWRQFLRDRHAGLSRPETVGLIGELLVLEKLLHINAGWLTAWQAPNSGLHDFQHEGHALEVKTALGPSSSITISKLDQLDDIGLRRLDLLSVRLIEAPNGRSLQNIVGDILSCIPNDGARQAFSNALLRWGLMPNDNLALQSPRIELRIIEAYSIRDGFPRLSRASLPIAISEASYRLEIRSLAPFLRDVTSIIDEFIRRDNS